jgi:type I restriction enzyme M protein
MSPEDQDTTDTTAALEPQDERQQDFIGALKALGGSAGNGKLRDLLGWEEAEYETVKAALLSAGTLVTGRGRGGSVSLAGANGSSGGNGAPKPATAPPAPEPQPVGKQSLSAFIWGVADLLRGDYKQSDYGKVILPFTVLRRLDCVLEPTKEAVLAEKELREGQGLDPEPFLQRS